RFLYTANADSNNVSVIDLGTKKAVAKIEIGVSPEALIMSPDGKRLYVTNETGRIAQLSVVDTGTNKVISAIQVGKETEGLAFSPDGRRLYTTNEAEDSVAIIDLAQNKITSRIPLEAVGHRPRGIAISPDEKRIYISLETSNALAVINATTKKL